MLSLELLYFAKEDSIEKVDELLRTIDDAKVVFTLLFITLHPSHPDGGLMRHACRLGSRNVVRYLLYKLPDSNLWNSLWTLGVLECNKDTMLRFWFMSVDPMKIMDDLCILSSNVVLHMFKCSQSKYFLEWLQSTDLSYLDFLYSSSFNPYRSFLEQRSAMQQAMKEAKPNRAPVNARIVLTSR